MLRPFQILSVKGTSRSTAKNLWRQKMYPYINLFGLSIPSYGLMMALAFIAAILIAYHRTNKAGLDTDALLTLAIITLTCGLAGSYLLYIFVTYSLSEIWGSIVDGSFSVFKSGGLVFYGGLIVGVLSGWIYLHAKKASFYEYAAVIVPAIPLAHAIGRIGCFLAGCCYGRIVDTPISVYYRNPIGGAPVGVPVFPIQLVESACNILVFVILLIYTRKRLKAGSVLFLYAILYGIERFCLEYFRADEIRGIFLGLSTSQWISIAMIIFGIVGFVLARRRQNRINKAQSGEQIQTEPLSDNIHSENSPSDVG